ncbi:MAG TPA: pyruvate dehydrogenase, partial [Chloroflexi bacterium]|nr:pyruvate dehydrogenase [Chloroflexota bacterium]
LTSRIMDEIEEKELTPQGKIAYQFSAKGHELAQVLLAQHLTHPHDGATGYYRSRPFMLASGLSVQEAFAGSFAKAGSITEGRDTGVMFSMKPRSAQGGLTVLPTSGNVGAQYTPAAGWAQAIRYHQRVLQQKEWEGAIVVAMGGEGSTAANGFWAALNIVTTRELPYLFFIEDNSFAISVRSALQTPGANVAANLQCYNNLRNLEADGTNPADASAKIAEAVEYVRAGKPCLLRMKVVRIMGHTFIDDQAYKTEKEKSEEIKRDPLIHLKDFLPDLDWDALEKDVEAEIRTASEAALQHPDPEPATVTKYLFASIPASTTPTAPLSESGPRINLIEAVKRTLESEMQTNPRLLVFGEDVGVKGGVHGATAHMQEKFGAERVFDTSLSEDGIMGGAVGLSLAGLLPVPEIQFRKYADPATEQINDTGTIRWRTAGKFAAPMVVRIPVGYGKKTGDPWHSVTGEAIYAHTLGWRLAFPSNAADAAGLLRTALRGEDPLIFFEHRALLDTSQARRPWPGDEYMLPLGVAGRLSEGDALTVVTWGAMVYPVLEAAKGLPGVETLDLRTISPWDKASVLESVKKTGKCLVVHEDTLTGGFAGEIIATIASEAFEWLDAPLQRLVTPDCPIPYNIPMMNAILPGAESIREKLEWLLDY